jgi:hypothetical protein
MNIFKENIMAMLPRLQGNSCRIREKKTAKE